MGMAVLKAPPLDMRQITGNAVCPTPWKDPFTDVGHARAVVKDMVARSKRSKRSFRPQAPYQCRCGSVHLSSADRVSAYGSW